MQVDQPNYFEIGIYQPLHTENIGTLWRSAYQLGASGIFTIGKAHPQQHSDTEAVWRHIPYRRYASFEQFKASLPYGCQLVGLELSGNPLGGFHHPARCVYLLGSEANGLPSSILDQCHAIITVESIHKASYNVSVAGSLVLYSRWLQYH